jgi:hypothetical protein
MVVLCMNNELERIRNEVVVAKVNEQNHEKLQPG